MAPWGFEDLVVLKDLPHQMSAPIKAINSHDAVKIYGGVLLVDNTRRKKVVVDNRRNKNPPRREAAIDCFEAAQKYGGVLEVDYTREKIQPLRKQAYY